MAPTKTQGYVLDRIRKTHGDKYDLSKVVYKGNAIKVEVICKKHGSFFCTPNNLVNGTGCYYCAKELVGSKNTISFEDCLQMIQENQGDIPYTLEESTYRGTSKPMKMFCPTHGTFSRKPIYLISTPYGCPKCHEGRVSLGEKKVLSILENFGFFVTKEFRFRDCQNVYTLPFDFAVFSDKEKKNMVSLVEYDGKQHYEPIAFFKNASLEDKINNLRYNQQNDSIKNDFCKERNIPLIRVRYDEKNILGFLSLELDAL